MAVCHRLLRPASERSAATEYRVRGCGKNARCHHQGIAGRKKPKKAVFNKDDSADPNESTPLNQRTYIEDLSHRFNQIVQMCLRLFVASPDRIEPLRRGLLAEPPIELGVCAHFELIERFFSAKFAQRANGRLAGENPGVV